MDISEEFASANQALQAGDYNTVTSLCQKILDANPTHLGALSLLGIGYYQSHDYDSAVSAFQKAIALNPQLHTSYFNLGSVFKAQQKPSAAFESYKKALQLAPTHIETAVELAELCVAQKQYEMAIAYLNHAININFNLPVLHEKLAAIFSLLGRTENVDEETFYAQIKSAQEKTPDVAIGICDAFLSRYPKHVDAWTYKGVAQEALKDHEGAIVSYQQALSLDPALPLVLVNKGNAEQSLARYENAFTSFDAAFNLNPHYVPAELNRGVCGLLLQKYSSAWQDYECRLSTTLEGRTEDLIADYHHFKNSQWKGQPHKEDYLFIWNEQGIGDEILFSSMFNDTQPFFEKVIIEADPRLVDVFARSFPAAHVIARKPSRDYLPPPNKKIWSLPCGSLGQFFRNSALDFPNRDSFLIADAQKSNEYKHAFKNNSGSPLIGISWKSVGKTGNYKSLPIEAFAKRLANCPSAQFLSLQYLLDKVDHRLFEEHAHQPLHLPSFDVFHNIDDLAALINACDMIITCSNLTAHVAGALGKSTFLLTPTGDGLHWYWGVRGSTTPWYKHIHIIRQPHPGDWGSAFDELDILLQQYAQQSQ
jgi:tetratricopeptide (TPR) repeat protein